MIKKACQFFISLILFLGAQLSLFARPKDPYVHFSGKITTDMDSLKYVVRFYKNYLTGTGDEIYNIPVKVNKEGFFSFDLPTNYTLSRLFLYESSSHTVICDDQIVESGDKIVITGNINNNNDIANFQFSGEGSAKYNCVEAFRPISSRAGRLISGGKNDEEKIHIADSLILETLHILDKYKRELRNEIHSILKTDMIGMLRREELFRVFLDVLYDKSGKASEDVSKRKIFDEFVLKDDHLTEKSILFSKNYAFFLIQKEEIELLFSKHGMNFEFKDEYLALKEKYRGLVRAKVLALYLTDPQISMEFFTGVDADDYSWCLHDATQTVYIKSMRDPILNLLSTRNKGTEAFNFQLPADSSGRYVKLSDLRGKVVLIDMWGYQCTGCTAFAQIFHQKIYPQFKDNKNFSVVSVMVDESSKIAYMKRLRSIIDPRFPRYSIYTYPDYINLFGGKGEEMGRLIRMHYNITAFPFILLVDKSGRIISSTIPFFTDPNSPNVLKLIALIQKALVV